MGRGASDEQQMMVDIDDVVVRQGIRGINLDPLKVRQPVIYAWMLEIDDIFTLNGEMLSVLGRDDAVPRREAAVVAINQDYGDSVDLDPNCEVIILSS